MNEKKPVKREFSSGGVVFKRSKIKDPCLAGRQEKSKIYFLLGKHSGYHKWVLPKGLIEKGEKGIETAIRETKEEMGVTARIIGEKPIHKEEYFYVADLKDYSQSDDSTRRVEKYQEEGGGKTKVSKTVTFYLMEYLAGDPKNHGWEMEEAGWFGQEEALTMLAFEGEKEAVRNAIEHIIILI